MGLDLEAEKWPRIPNIADTASYKFPPASLAAGTAEDAEDKEKEKLKFGVQIEGTADWHHDELVQSEKNLAVKHQLQTNTRFFSESININ